VMVGTLEVDHTSCKEAFVASSYPCKDKEEGTWVAWTFRVVDAFMFVDVVDAGALVLKPENYPLINFSALSIHLLKEFNFQYF